MSPSSNSSLILRARLFSRRRRKRRTSCSGRLVRRLSDLFNRQMVIMSLLQGFGVLIILLAIFGIALYRGQGEARCSCFNLHGARDCQRCFDCYESILVADLLGHSANAKSCHVVGSGQCVGLSGSRPVYAVSQGAVPLQHASSPRHRALRRRGSGEYRLV